MLRKLIALAFVALLFGTLGCSSKTDNSSQAIYVAQKWVSANTESLAEKVTQPISDEFPNVPRFAIKMAISKALNGLSWSFNPQRIREDEWTVAVTSQANFALPVLGDTIDLKGGVDLRVDTKNEIVPGVTLNPDHFKFTRTPKVSSTPPAEQAVAQNKSWPRIRIHNDCTHPINVLLGYMSTDGSRSWASFGFSPNENALLQSDGSAIRAVSGKIFTYAESSDGTKMVWHGEKEITLSRPMTMFNASEFKVTEHDVSVNGDEDYTHTFNCPGQ